MTRIVAVFNMKGGVGKSTIAVNIAACAAQDSDKAVLLWDLDAQGAASYLLGNDELDHCANRIFEREVEAAAAVHATPWPRLDLMAADISLRDLDQILAAADKPKLLRKLLKPLRERYDTIILDVPPGLGEISEQVFRAVDLIVVPVVPTPLAERSLTLVGEHIARYPGRKPDLLPVVSMVDRRKKLHREFVANHADWPIIPLAAIIENSTVTRRPVVISAPRSQAAEAFADLWSAAKRQMGSSALPVLPRPRGPKVARDAARH